MRNLVPTHRRKPHASVTEERIEPTPYVSTADRDRLHANAAARQRAEAQHADLLTKMLDVYYLASGLYAHRGVSNPEFNYMRHGEMYAATKCIALLLGKDSITVSRLLENGLPVDGTNATETDRAKRLDDLHRGAMARDNHPMFTIVYHPERLR